MAAKYRLDCKLVNGFVIRDRSEPQHLVTDDDLERWIERQNKVPRDHPLKMSWVVNKWNGERYVAMT